MGSGGDGGLQEPARPGNARLGENRVFTLSSSRKLAIFMSERVRAAANYPAASRSAGRAATPSARSPEDDYVYC